MLTYVCIWQLSPLSTLESSFEALNVKKFDGDHTSNALFLLMMDEVMICFFCDASCFFGGPSLSSDICSI